MARGISLRAFARAMGVTLSAVQEARDSKRIALNRNGTIDLVKGRRAWAQNTLHSKRPPRPRQAKRRAEAPIEDLGSMTGQWHQARAAREAIQARILQLDLEKRQRHLLDAEEVRRSTAALARRTRDRLLALPGRLGPEVSGLAPLEATRLLQDEVDRILDELAAGAEPSENGHGRDD